MFSSLSLPSPLFFVFFIFCREERNVLALRFFSFSGQGDGVGGSRNERERKERKKQYHFFFHMQMRPFVPIRV